MARSCDADVAAGGAGADTGAPNELFKPILAFFQAAISRGVGGGREAVGGKGFLLGGRELADGML